MDFSKALGDLYGTDKSDAGEDAGAPPPPPADEGPEWADEARLDAAFGSWVPGPPADAPAAERQMAGLEDAGPTVDDEAPGEPFGGETARAATWFAREAATAAAAPAGQAQGQAQPGQARGQAQWSVEAGSAEAGSVEAGSPGAGGAGQEAEPAPQRWSRSDDDVLPGPRPARRGLGLRRR